MEKREVLKQFERFDPTELFKSPVSEKKLARLEREAAENLADAEKQWLLDEMIRVAPQAIAEEKSIFDFVPRPKHLQNHKSDRNGSGLLKLAAVILNCGS